MKNIINLAAFSFAGLILASHLAVAADATQRPLACMFEALGTAGPANPYLEVVTLSNCTNTATGEFIGTAKIKTGSGTDKESLSELNQVEPGQLLFINGF